MIAGGRRGAVQTSYPQPGAGVFPVPGILVTDLSFGYGDGQGARDTLKSVNLSVPRGAVTAVVGPNGAGKSTLLKVISAYLRPSKGSVLVHGLDPFALSPAERSRRVTYCGDEPEPAYGFTVEETVLMGRLAAQGTRENNPQVAAGAMDEAGVYELRDRAITSLSSGERQRVYIARAICQDPDVFLLDEPTAHLDMAYELQVMELVVEMTKRKGKTALAVVHDLNLALRYASKLFFLKDGEVRHEIEPAQVTAEVIREIYGVDALVTANPALGCPVVIPLAQVRPR